jgi:hypothetical protein
MDNKLKSNILSLSLALIMISTVNVNAQADLDSIGIEIGDKFIYTVQTLNITDIDTKETSPFYVIHGDSESPSFGIGENFTMIITSIEDSDGIDWLYTATYNGVSLIGGLNSILRGLAVHTDWNYWEFDPPSKFYGDYPFLAFFEVNTINENTNLTITPSELLNPISHQIETVTYDKELGVVLEYHVHRTYKNQDREFLEVKLVKKDLVSTEETASFIIIPYLTIGLMILIIIKNLKANQKR